MRTNVSGVHCKISLAKSNCQMQLWLWSIKQLHFRSPENPLSWLERVLVLCDDDKINYMKFEKMIVLFKFSVDSIVSCCSQAQGGLGCGAWGGSFCVTTLSYLHKPINGNDLGPYERQSERFESYTLDLSIIPTSFQVFRCCQQ